MSEDVELAEGAGSALARELAAAITRTLERHPERRESLRRLRGSVAVRAEDADEAATLEFGDGRVRIHDGERGGASIRILGDRESISAVTRLAVRRGVPLVWSEPGRLVLRRQLGGELTVRGLLLRAPRARHVLRLLASG